MYQSRRMIFFDDRNDAANQLADRLHPYRGKSPVVLGIPRGGMPMAAQIADQLGGELDAIFIKKIGAPGNPELAVGAVGENGDTYLNREIIDSMGIPVEYLEEAIEQKIEANRFRAKKYRAVKPRVELEGRTVILVDDGVATGATAHACLSIIRKEYPASLIFAVPVAFSDSLDSLRPLANSIICLQQVNGFYGGISAFYREFSQVSDEEVLDILRGNPASVSKSSDEPIH